MNISFFKNVHPAQPRLSREVSLRIISYPAIAWITIHHLSFKARDKDVAAVVKEQATSFTNAFLHQFGEDPDMTQGASIESKVGDFTY